MYVEHFRLRADPFKVTPDSQFYFRGERQRAAEVDLLAALEQPDGLVLLAASAGCGKTLLLRQAAEQLKPRAPVAMVWNPALPFEDLLASVCAQLGVNEPADDVPHRMRSIEFLAQHALSEGHAPVVMIDDADNLPDQTLHRLTELCALRIDGRQAIGLVLTSDLDGCDFIRGQLSDEIPVQRVTLAPLADSEVAEYVQHRLGVAGSEGQSLFTRAALARLAEISRGVPRLVNVLAGKALFVAYLGEERQVGEDLVEEVAGELWSTIESDLPPAPVGSPLADRMESHPAVNGRGSPTPPPAPAPVAAPTEGTVEPTVTAEEVLVDLSRLARVETPARAHAAVPGPSAPDGRRPVATPLVLVLVAVLGLGAFLSTEFGQDWSRDQAQPVIDGFGHTMRDRMSVRDIPTSSGADQTQADPLDHDVAVLPVPSVAEAPAADRAGATDASEAPLPGPKRHDVPRMSSNPAPRPTLSYATSVGESWVDSLDGGRARIRRLLSQAVTHLNAGHYTDPAGDNALEDYRRVLELDPGNLLATRGIEALLGRLVRWGRVAESRGDWEAAVDYYQAAVHIDPESDELQSALRRTRRLNNTGLIQGG